MLMLICQSESFRSVEDIIQKFVRRKIRFHRERIVDCLCRLNDGIHQFADALLDQLFLSQRPFSRELLGRV